MKPNKSNFAVFILTHGRPEKVITYNTLKKCGYTGKIYFIVDNEDDTVPEYIDKFGKENVIIFDKDLIEKEFDTADTFKGRAAIFYARNASWKIAKELGLDYYCQLDDDYTDFLYRFDDNGVMSSRMVRSVDKVIKASLDLLEDTGAVCIAWSQGGDYIGGEFSALWKSQVRRKAMNSMFFRVDRPVEFLGKINEDVSTYVVHGSRGNLFLTVAGVQLNQVQTQKSSGGMTEYYKDSGTYVKSFYSIIMAPSCVKISTMGRTDRRFHHLIKWNNAVPKIISERYKKAIT